jgi:hypothetical protein
MKRIPSNELLDSDAGTAAEIQDSLADLRRINLWFGGVRTTQLLIQRIVHQTGKSQLSLLEVAAGSGDVVKNAQKRLGQRGITLRTTLLDRAHSHVTNNGQAIVADCRALPCREGSFDLVSCCLFAHHLSPDELVQFVQGGLRVCRVAVLINDLIRDPVHLALVYAGLPLFRSRLTHHDAPASVRQAYTPAEMHHLLSKTGAVKIEIGCHYLYRMGVIAWKA